MPPPADAPLKASPPKPAPPIREGLHPIAAAVPLAAWRWPHFKPTALACKCRRHCRGEYWHDPDFLDALERLRAQAGPVRINSGRRCRRHNAAVGGATRSLHTLGVAADVSLKGHDRAKLARAAVRAGFTGLGFGRAFLHVDLGPARRWTYPGAPPAWIAALGFDPVKGFARLKAAAEQD